MLLANSQLGIKKIANTLKPFDLEFQPYIEEINAKEGDIRKYADAASMERIKSMYDYIFGVVRYKTRSNARIDIQGDLQDITLDLKPLAKLNG